MRRITLKRNLNAVGNLASYLFNITYDNSPKFD